MQDHRRSARGRDLLVLGRIRTLDPAVPVVAAMAVRDGRVAAIGRRSEVEATVAGGHEVIDVGSRLILPGFIDAHVHLVDGGLFLAALDLAGVRSRAEWDERVSRYVAVAGGAGGGAGASAAGAAADADPWITGGGWDHERWGGVLPDRGWLDRHTGPLPALLTRSDLHMALANTSALERAGIDRDGRTADPDGGQILRGPDGSPTGVLRDTAIELVACRIPVPTDGELDAALRRAIDHAHRHGVTQVHDMGELPPSWRDLEVLERAHEAGRLDLRVSVATPTSDWPALAERIRKHGYGSGRLWWGSVKGFVDGSLGAGTARFHEPFDDLPHTRGLVVSDPDHLRADIAGAWAAGIQPIVHAIGDAAVDWLVDVYTTLGPPVADVPPPRIEHAQHLGPDTAERMARSGAIASMQPSHLVADAPWLERRVGPDRARRAYAVRTLAEAGVPLAFGSDWTVAPLDPLGGIRAAVERVGVDGRVFAPEQRITTERALHGHTVGAAEAGGFRGRTGALSPGACADFVVLDGVAEGALDAVPGEDIGRPDPYEGLGEGSSGGLGEARVVRTFVDGIQVYHEERE